MNVRHAVPAAIAAVLAVVLSLAACQREPAATAPATAASPTPAPSPVAAPSDPPPATDAQPRVTASTTAPVEATDEEVERAYDRLDAAAKKAAEQWQDKSFDDFLATIYREPGENGKWIVGGDLAFSNRKLLEEYFKQMKSTGGQTAGGKLIVQGNALIVNAVAGSASIWNTATKRNLTYCVSNTFGPRQASVIADMEAATSAWEKVSDVDFRHVAAEDASCNAANANVVFDVRPVDVNGQYLARAFFPNEPRPDRNVLIDETSFDLDPGEKLTLVGILRHELGHTLGWRHEHTRPQSGTCFEDENWIPMTDYDKFSVMHYPQCNGGGDWSLELTDLDKAGAACVYGAADGFTGTVPGGCPPLVPPATGTAQTESFADQSVAALARKDYGPFDVKVGTRFEAHLHAAGATPGDPDLYVRFQRTPLRTNGRFDCRPYLVGAEESCELDVPALPEGRRKAYVMVYGYSAATYSLEVKHTPE